MAKRKYTSVEKQVSYGLKHVKSKRTVKVSMRDLLYIHQTLGELVRFFHQPMHTETLADVKKFMGNANAGALHVIWECYYKKMRKMLPSDIYDGFDNGLFENPNPPYYYKAKRRKPVAKEN
jgi:hypothetical protein